MRRAHRIDKVVESDTSDNSSAISERVKNILKIYQTSGKGCCSAPAPKCEYAYTNSVDHYCIIIKPKLYKSCSLSDINSEHREQSFHYQKNKEYLRTGSNWTGQGDNCRPRETSDSPVSMSHNLKPIKQEKKVNPGSIMYASNFASEYLEHTEIPFEATKFNETNTCDKEDHASKLTFPFKQTPSGNFKIQSNQVVFQSPTVGVLLADPANAKVKVKFEDSNNTSVSQTKYNNCDPELFCARERRQFLVGRAETNDPTTHSFRMDQTNEKDLKSLGYFTSEPVDWTRVQLPKKVDLYQEFYRRVRNYINTDIIIHIETEVFHCHLMVLSIYSGYFDNINEKNVELPASNVSPRAFQAIYEWMMLCGSDSHKVLRRDNILDIFCAAQYLSVKDLEEQCWSFIVSEELFTEDTAFALLQEARLKEITPVMELMVPRVTRFFLPLVASSDFIKLSLDEVIVFLTSNYIRVTSEMEVLMSGVRWLLGDWATRHRYVTDVMRCVRFGLISPWQLVDLKRNKDNPELLQMIQEPEVQSMVDDGLAYVIIKYWNGNNLKNYSHWIEVLGLSEPAERNWIADEKSHSSYKEFLSYLEQFQVPRDQAYQLLSMQHSGRRGDDVQGMRGGDADKLDMRRPKIDFPLPANLKGLADKEKGFPTMSEFFESRRKARETVHDVGASQAPILESDDDRGGKADVHQYYQESLAEEHGRQLREQMQLQLQIKQQKQQLETLQKQQAVLEFQREQLSSRDQQSISVHHGSHTFSQAEKDVSTEVTNYKMTTDSDDSSTPVQHNSDEKLRCGCNNSNNRPPIRERSPAATYLAAATAALASTSKGRGNGRLGTPRPATNDGSPEHRVTNNAQSKPQSPEHHNMNNTCKEMLSMANIARLSHSVLGPSNKNYMVEGSLFNWDRDTVLVFGGVDPHTMYGVGKNTGRDIHKFDPVNNIWEYIGDLPQPRHHHSVSLLRGRVYLVGGADPREDDVRGKSVVVGSVWSYNPATRIWVEEPPLAIPRKNFGLIVHRMALYAIGGQDRKGRVLKSVERYDARSNSWSEVAPLCVGRMGVACAKYREYIWVAGGMTGDRRHPLSRVVECYNSSTNEWTEINTLRFPRCFATLFSMNDKLYLLGGAARLSEKDKSTCSVGAIDVWDLRTNEWKPHAEMTVPRHGHALAYLGTQLFIIGGVTTMYMRALSSVESYCCERQAWIRGVAELSVPLSGHGAVTLPPASFM